MNDPNKIINVNLSSLLSLKAELVRKQAEVKKAKETKVQPCDFIPSKSNSSSKNNAKTNKMNVKELEKKDSAIVYEVEDSALLLKSKRVLEAKSKYYDRMSRSGGNLNSDDNCLVLFNRKRQEQQTEPTSNTTQTDSDKSDDGGDLDDPIESDDDWVEYEDCLGRTRKCLRKDLENEKRRDKDLADSMPERLDQTKANWMIDIKGTTQQDNDDEEQPIGPRVTESIFSDGYSMMSKHDEQRMNWERKEQENLEKPDVHYQDVFFDEARQHGVGYYAFSTDEEERQKQQRELAAARNQTLAEQEKRDAIRSQRERLVAERVLAAKNRIRARAGLPPLTKEELELEERKNQFNSIEETREQRKERKKTEKLERKKEKAEAQRELERQDHIRPWDLQKDGVAGKTASDSETNVADEWHYKPERLPMSQEEWNEKQRAQRKPEFAPMPEIVPKRTNFASTPPAVNLSFQHITMPPPPSFSTVSTDKFTNYQTTKRKSQFLRRNYTNTDVDAGCNRGAEIPPPKNLDTNNALPPHSKQLKTDSDLERSIEAGLRFLRDNCDKDNMSTKSSWTAKIDY